MVVPTKVIPRAIRSREIRSDSSEWVGTTPVVFTRVCPWVKPHRYRSKLPNSY